jgi:hypothetical protein
MDEHIDQEMDQEMALEEASLLETHPSETQ